MWKEHPEAILMFFKRAMESGKFVFSALAWCRYTSSIFPKYNLLVMLVFASPHTKPSHSHFPLKASLATQVLSTPSSNLTSSLTAKTAMIFPSSDIPQEFLYLA